MSITDKLLRLPFFPNDNTESADGSLGYEHRWEHYRTIGTKRPQVGVEIGGHFGFGVITMLDALPDLKEVFWVDNETAIEGSNAKCSANINAYLEAENRACGAFAHLSVTELHCAPDVVFVDGDHNYGACLVDLGWALAQWPYMIMVDDFTAIGGVRDACIAFSQYTGLTLEQDAREAGVAIFRP